MNKRETALKHFDNSFSCAQSILLTFSEDLGLDEPTAAKVSEGFGGGMGALGNTCGAVSAAYMVLGLKYGRKDMDDLDAKAVTNDKVQEFNQRFKKIFKFDMCLDLLGGYPILTEELRAKAREEGAFSNCSEYVVTAARILEEMMKED